MEVKEHTPEEFDETPSDFEFLVYDHLKVLSGSSAYKEAGVEAGDIQVQLRHTNKLNIKLSDVAKSLHRMEKEGMAEGATYGRYIAIDFDPTWGG